MTHFSHTSIIFAKKKLWELYASTRKNNFHPHKLVTVNSLLVNVYQFSQNKEFNEYLSLNIDEDPHIYMSMKTLFFLKLQKLPWTNLNVFTVSKSANRERQKTRQEWMQQSKTGTSQGYHHIYITWGNCYCEPSRDQSCKIFVSDDLNLSTHNVFLFKFQCFEIYVAAILEAVFYLCSWGSSWSYGSLIYNYVCNLCLSPLKLKVWISLIARCTWYNIMR